MEMHVDYIFISYADVTGGHLVTLDLPLTLNTETIVRLYREKLEANPDVKLVLLGQNNQQYILYFLLKKTQVYYYI